MTYEMKSKRIDFVGTNEKKRRDFVGTNEIDKLEACKK